MVWIPSGKAWESEGVPTEAFRSRGAPEVCTGGSPWRESGLYGFERYLQFGTPHQSNWTTFSRLATPVGKQRRFLGRSARSE